MLAAKALIGYTSLLLPRDFKKNDKIILNHIKMEEAPNLYPNLSDQIQFKLKKINKIKDYIIAEIHEREAMSKEFSKHIVAFDYFDKAFIFLSATSRGISIASFARIIGAPVRIARASFNFAFSIATGIVRKNIANNTERKKHYKIVMLARSELSNVDNSITTITMIMIMVITQALINSEISHEEYTKIIN